MIYLVKWMLFRCYFCTSNFDNQVWASWPRKKNNFKALKEVNGHIIENGSRGRKDMEDLDLRGEVRFLWHQYLPNDLSFSDWIFEVLAWFDHCSTFLRQSSQCQFSHQSSSQGVNVVHYGKGNSVAHTVALY